MRHDLAAAQRVLATGAAAALAAAGLIASVGEYGGHFTADAAMPDGSLVLVPMGALWDLDPDLAAEDGADPDDWHVLARDASGTLLEPGHGYPCPSVLWAVDAGLDPAVAPFLVEFALADPAVAALLGLDSR